MTDSPQKSQDNIKKEDKKSIQSNTANTFDDEELKSSDNKQPATSTTKEPPSQPSPAKSNEEKKEKTKHDKDCDTDSDSESEEDRLEEEEQRKKLLAEVDVHKHKMYKIIFILIGIEVIVCSILIMSPSDADGNYNNNGILARLYDFRNDTLDCVLASILRIICLLSFINLAIQWGNVKTYDTDKENHTIFNINTSQYKLYTKVRGSIAYIILNIWNSIIGLNSHNNKYNNYSVNNDEYSSLFLQETNHINYDDIKTDNGNVVDKKDKIKKLFNLNEFISKYAGMDAQDVADLWKLGIWMTLFFLMTLFQTYIGIKISFYTSNNDNSYYYYIGLFSLIIILTHSQSYFAKQYIDDCCQPSNRYLDTNIHPHPVYLTKDKGRPCCRCWRRAGAHSTQHKKMYKCLKCPNHRAFICIKCWNKTKKALKQKEKDKKDDKGDDDDNVKDVSIREYFLTLLQYHRPYIHLLIIGVITMAINSIVNIFVPRQRGLLIDRLINNDVNGFYYAIKLKIFLTILTGILSQISHQSLSRISMQVTCDLQKRLFSNLMAQDMNFFDNHTTTEINERMNWGLSEMLSPFQQTINTILNSGIRIIGGLYMCLSISWRLTFLGLTTLGPMSYFMQTFSRWNWQRNIIQQQLHREMYMISYLGFEHIRAVRAFAKEHEFVKYYSLLRQEADDTDNKRRLVQSLNSTINSWFSLGTKILLTYIAGIIILSSAETNTTLTVGLYITFQTYWNQLYSTIRTIRGTINTYDNAFFMAKKIFKTLQKKSKIEHLLHEKNNANNSKLINKIDGNIKFENVEYFYESSPNKLVLKNLNFEIEKGKTTALVGRSGGGKSTIMHLILRFYDPTKGNIYINNINIKKYNPYSLRRKIALVAQDTELFHKSVEYNIGFGANKLIKNLDFESSYNLNEVQYSAKLANAHKFIDDMEDKYDTKMGTRAKRCSGGQKQRISIARMLMSKPSIMLLDEATSSLDAESEALVQAAMERECEEKDCTLVIVAHRLSTVVNADKICVVDDGNIVEQGTHDELIDLNGIYAALVKRQVNLKSKMKKKLNKIHSKKKCDNDKNKNDNDAKEEDDDDDFDNIDKLIDQIKAEKKKEKLDDKQVNKDKDQIKLKQILSDNDVKQPIKKEEIELKL